MKIARAMMNPPMNRKISGSANGTNTTRAGATPSITHAAAPKSAVTGIGSASVIHSTTTALITAASRCAAGGSSPIGASSITMNTSGASTAPDFFRHRSKRCSAADNASGV
jgi:hypothetical protein